MFEQADKRAAKPARKVTLRGKVLNVDDPDPIAIARALRKNKPGRLKTKKEAMEKKFAGN
ncbi:hypothetical protein J4G48_0020230 [Bradyrhizobium barranii subsp. apii]|uniref:hypothetical protein n=1 Tax=Bradyrhizobium barranii TaxID=2992140 RepID=UPI001AA0EF22|nr:hypothetical protein [Bradyrhizobium barranii]UPU00212.1 hypothetical protein J4G48_0020230 [Bradyrhizobium barranii subsp. apii]